jgi:hypothetical protein
MGTDDPSKLGLAEKSKKPASLLAEFLPCAICAANALVPPSIRVNQCNLWLNNILSCSIIKPFRSEMLMRYIFDRDLDKPAFRRKLKTLRNLKLSKNAMSLAEQFRQEGIRKGRQQGRQEGRQEGLVRANQAAILEALEIRFNRVPEGLREEIELIADTAKLQSLLRAAITRADLESFAAEL